VDIKLKKNTLWALVEVIVSALFVFVVYRIVIYRLGVGALGVWSLVLATTSLVRVIDPGTSAGIGRFIAVANACDRVSEVGDYFIAALVSTFIFYALFSLIAYWPLKEALGFALSGDNLGTADDLLPYAIASFLLMNFNGAIQGALVGLQRSNVKSQIAMGGLAIQLILVLALTSSEGLKGLALAQIAQYCISLLVGYLIVVRHIRGCFALGLPFALKRSTFAELWSFGLRLQAISIVSFLYEPLSKFIISSVAGVEVLGIFELAQKFILQVRQLIVGPTTILMPAFTHVNHRFPNELATLYRRSLAATIIVGSSLMGAAVIGSPIVSAFWLGHIDKVFLIFVCMLSAAWLVNIIASPAYVLALSQGALRWNFWGAVVTSLGGPALALTIGRAFGPIGVVAATVMALAAGSLFSMVMNSRQAAMPGWTNISDIRRFILYDLVRLISHTATTAGKS
jgi:O-antigen/teichoic acid export membrane protein